MGTADEIQDALAWLVRIRERLEATQKDPQRRNRETACAITKIEEAEMWLERYERREGK